MRGRTFALSQKELQRVSVISSCVKGDMACARAAELLSLRRPSGQASQETFSGAGRGSSGARQSRTTQSPPPALPSAASRRPSGPHDLCRLQRSPPVRETWRGRGSLPEPRDPAPPLAAGRSRLSQKRSEEHTSELQSRQYLVCRLLLGKKKRNILRVGIS